MPATAQPTIMKDDADRASALLAASGQVPPERLRLLRSVFGRFCQILRDELFAVAKVNFETSLKRLEVESVEETGVQGADMLLALCSVKGHNTLSGAAFDFAAVNLIIEAFLGGGAKGRTLPGPRAFTPFDHLLAGHAAEIAGKALTEAFAPSHEGFSISVDEVRTAESVEELRLEERPVLAAHLELAAMGEAGRCVILLPPGIVSGMSACAVEAAPPASAEEGGDNPWRDVLDGRIRAAEVTCKAVMDGGFITLEDVSRLRPGQILELETREATPVALECNGERLFHCELGQAQGAFTLLLRAPAGDREDFLQSVLDNRKA